MLNLLLAALTGPDYAAAARVEAGRDPCRSRAADEVVVCGARRRSRYAVTDPRAPFDVHGDVMSVMREHQSWGDAGGAGIGSCSPVGPGGWTGCLVQKWKRNDQQNPRRK
jgi:hypothetical protein